VGKRLRLAFIDDDLENYHANTFLALARGAFADRVEVAGCWARAGDRGRAWAGARGVAWVDDPARLAARVDGVCVLAPSTPETHLELCRAVLPAGKPTFVDKTFAPDLATARAILALADRHGAPIQTSSALRSTNVQREATAMGAIRHAVVWGGGGSYDEYVVHPLELAVSVLGWRATAVMRRGGGRDAQLLVDFAEGRSAVVNVHVGGETPFLAALTNATTTRIVPVDSATLFSDAFAPIVDFIGDGRPRVDRRETLAIRAIMDAAADPRARERPLALDGAVLAAASGA